MFSKLKQQNITTKKPQRSPSPHPPSKSPKKRSTSYSAIQRRKLNDSDLFDYEIGWICDHLFQGCLLKNKKHGEGLLIQSNGNVVVGNWVNGLLNGYALVVTPFGGKLHVHYWEGKLHGWAIVEYANNFQILQFNRGVYQPLRRRYDQFQELWTQAIFSPDGKIQRILRIQKVNDFQLASFITDPQLLKFYDTTIMKGNTNLSLKKLSIIKINDKFQYYGYTNDKKVPQGLGVIYSCNQIYAGNFKAGSLDQHGLILFPNGVIYKGEIYSGKIWGDGIIYDVNLDQTKIVKVSQQGIQYVVDQEEGCNLDAVAFGIGRIPKMPPEKGYSEVIDQVCEQMKKYYFRTNSSYQVQPEQQTIQNPQRQSQELRQNHNQINSNQNENKDKRKQMNNINRKKYKYTSSNNSEKSSLSNKTSKKTPKYVEQNNSQDFEESQEKQNMQYSQQQIKKQLKRRIRQQLDSLQFSQMSQIKPSPIPQPQAPKPNPTQSPSPNQNPAPIPVSPLLPLITPPTPKYTIPSGTPTFEQISRKDNSNDPKIMYPYLLEFQMGKNVFAPYKISNIGRIVANSLKIAEKYY